MKEFLNRFNLSLIIVTYSAMVLSLYVQLNLLVILFGTTCAGWRIAHFYGKLIFIPRWLLTIVAFATTIMTIALLYQQGFFNIMLHLIFLGFSLKFLELKSLRDVYFFVNTGFILLALFFIFHSTLFSTLIALCLLFLLLATLLSLHTQISFDKRFILLVVKSCILSLPLAILLFVVMPRLPSLWKMPLQKQATTGLSDSVSPGDIAKLSRSSALAFRVTFKDDVAPENERYWRAMTMDNFDGKTWSQSDALKKQESDAKRGGGLRFYPLKNSAQFKTEYELIIEPHYNYWIPVLDYAVTPNGLISLSDYSLRSERPIVARKAFSVAQLMSMTNNELTPAEKKQFTQLPTQLSTQLSKGSNSQTDNWITENLKKGVNKDDILTQLLYRFSQSFRYTLEPPPLGEQQIDDFLFNKKAGFCVHYASSYLYVARRLGFPARMVTGYLGGEWQSSEGFFTVRQYDAHAWVEIWKGNRWLRIDPTSYVAPERVESGLQAALSDANEFLANEYFSLQKWQSVELINRLRGRLAQLDYLWARYVVNFDNHKQMTLMQRWLTHIPWLNLAYAVMLLMAIIFSLLVMIIFKPWQVKKIAPEDKTYQQLQKHFSRLGFEHQNGQLISDYCLMLCERFALSATLCQAFTSKYNAIKYQPTMANIQRKSELKKLSEISKQLRKK